MYFLPKKYDIECCFEQVTRRTCWYYVGQFVVFRPQYFSIRNEFTSNKVRFSYHRLKVVCMPSFFWQVAAAVPALTAAFIPYLLSLFLSQRHFLIRFITSRPIATSKLLRLSLAFSVAHWLSVELKEDL